MFGLLPKKKVNLNLENTIKGTQSLQTSTVKYRTDLYILNRVPIEMTLNHSVVLEWITGCIFQSDRFDFLPKLTIALRCFQPSRSERQELGKNSKVHYGNKSDRSTWGTVVSLPSDRVEKGPRVGGGSQVECIELEFPSDIWFRTWFKEVKSVKCLVTLIRLVVTENREGKYRFGNVCPYIIILL